MDNCCLRTFFVPYDKGRYHILFAMAPSSNSLPIPARQLHMLPISRPVNESALWLFFKRLVFRFLVFWLSVIGLVIVHSFSRDDLSKGRCLKVWGESNPRISLE